ncbi:MAG: hypothetical protein IDH49_11805 [Gammaproteobacteria bacterium]|nr:hypothetical protein [Gammaproteobacteria bacterium]
MPDKSIKPTTYLLPAMGVLLIGTIAFLAFAKTPVKHEPGWINAWKPANSFHLPRRALAAAVAGDYLYVVGGIDDNDGYVRQTEYARINRDGTLGPWRITSSLNEGRFYLATVASDGYLYAIGGATGPRGDDNQPIASVERARINPDGSLGAWELANYLTTPRRGLKVVKHRNHIYAIGGYNGIFLKSVERVDVRPDGTLGDWQLEKEASAIDRYIHSAAILDGKIYLLGGHVRSPDKMSYGDVEMASIGPGAALTPWQIERSSLQTPRFIASAFAMNGYLYMSGGHDGQYRLDSVEYAPVDTEGHAGKWSYTAKLGTARSAAAVATHGNAVYVLGGMDSGALNTVEMALQSEGGRLGQPK